MIVDVMSQWARKDADGAFDNAWNTVVHALLGKWGEREFEIIPGTMATVRVQGGKWDVCAVVVASGSVEITLPYPASASQPVAVRSVRVSNGEERIEVTKGSTATLLLYGESLIEMKGVI